MRVRVSRNRQRSIVNFLQLAHQRREKEKERRIYVLTWQERERERERFSPTSKKIVAEAENIILTPGIKRRTATSIHYSRYPYASTNFSARIYEIVPSVFSPEIWQRAPKKFSKTSKSNICRLFGVKTQTKENFLQLVSLIG